MKVVDEVKSSFIDGQQKSRVFFWNGLCLGASSVAATVVKILANYVQPIQYLDGRFFMNFIRSAFQKYSAKEEKVISVDALSLFKDHSLIEELMNLHY